MWTVSSDRDVPRTSSFESIWNPAYAGGGIATTTAVPEQSRTITIDTSLITGDAATLPEGLLTGDDGDASASLFFGSEFSVKLATADDADVSPGTAVLVVHGNLVIPDGYTIIAQGDRPLSLRVGGDVFVGEGVVFDASATPERPGAGGGGGGAGGLGGEAQTNSSGEPGEGAPGGQGGAGRAGVSTQQGVWVRNYQSLGNVWRRQLVTRDSEGKKLLPLYNVYTIEVPRAGAVRLQSAAELGTRSERIDIPGQIGRQTTFPTVTFSSLDVVRGRSRSYVGFWATAYLHIPEGEAGSLRSHE